MTDAKQPAQDKPKRTKTPRTFESIMKGALELPLEEQGKLRDAIIANINKIAAVKRQEAEDAAKIAGA